MNNSKGIHVKIRDIGPGNENLLLRGVIIRNQDPRVVRIRRDNNERCVWSFTLRDSPSDLINVNIWGSVEYVQNLAARFQTGHVVDVSNVKAVFRKISDKDELYQPCVTSSFSAVFTENQSGIQLTLENTDEYLPLLNIPTKPPGNFLIISDIRTNGEKLTGQFINLLAAVRDLAPKKQFNSKNGKLVECREVTLIDQTYATLSLTIWSSDLLLRSDKWIPRNTVLFLADARVEWNNYRKIVIISTSGRTIITENPSIAKAQNLWEFLSSTPFQATSKLDQIIHKYSDSSLIRSVTSCAGVISKSLDEKQNSEFTALVYAMLHQFDIDGSDHFILAKCMRCNWRVDCSLDVCLNANCPSGTGNESPLIDQVYDLRISLMDHTGTLTNCRLTNSVTEKLLGFKKAALFHTLSDNEKTHLKWKYLLKYCAVKMVALPMKNKDMPIIAILSLDLISLSEYSSLIPMY